MGGAAASALAAIVARRAAVERLGQNRESRRHTGNVQPFGGLLDQQLIAARLRRRLKNAVRLVRHIRQVCTEDPDEPVDLVVVRFDVVVGDRPVVAEAVKSFPLKVVRTEPQRDAAPVVRPPAQHSRPEPVERVSGCRRVRLALDRPAAQRAVELAELPFRDGRASTRRIVRPFEHRRIGRRVPHGTRFEHDDVGAGLSQHHGGHAAASA